MTFDSITSMRRILNQVAGNLRYIRNVEGVSAHSDVSTRDVSIAITEIETACLWARRALQEQEMSVTDHEVERVSSEDPDVLLENIYGLLTGYINPLKEEYKSGSSDKWYRNAILQTYNHLEVARQRVRMQKELY